MLLTIVVFIITLLILVISHEFGHFLAARKFGVKVLEFGFGLPPRVFGKKWGETLVSLNWLPIGGFVKLLGEDETDKKVLADKRSFAVQPVLSRILIVAAGVTINLALAVILFYIVLSFQGFKEKVPLLVPYQFAGVNQTDEAAVFVGRVAAGSPAAASGLKEGDEIIFFNSTPIDTVSQFIDLTKGQAGKRVVLILADENDRQRTVDIVPRVKPPAGQGPLGVELMELKIANLDYATLDQKATSGFSRSYNFTVYSFKILGHLIARAWESRNFQPVSQSVSGPVGLTRITSTVLQSESPVLPYLNFLALLSLNLAIINILPVPALDGGRIFFLLIEVVFKRKVRAEVERLIHTVGMALLIALIVLITLSDIKKFF